ncbi:MAG: electron transfer flavoprotein subunit beta/FixA family protein [Thermodesulfobacteriota bacterium]|nr:electron transfer flavoprotein subunit beta/FixA family protein [Thermodesulfobacteriota bacterium]
MEIIVCIKQILDPDLPPAKFMVDSERNKVIPSEGIPFVINPYDALAVEAALKIKEEKGGKITVIAIGDKSTEDIVRKTLAMGADEGLIISDPVFEESDGFAVGYIIAQAIKKISRYDLILCGRQAADWDRGMVGSVVAEYLGIPVVTRAKDIKVLNGRGVVERVTADGFETFELELPALITVSSELGQARLPSGWGIIKAASKEISIWSGKEIEADTSKVGGKASRNQLMRLSIPSYNRRCEFVTGEDHSEITAKLTSKLMERRTP